MRFKIDNFILETEKKIEELDEQITVPVEIDRYNGKIKSYKWKNKTREFTVFTALLLFEDDDKKYYSVISDIFVFIDLIEILKAFNSNKLNTEKEYKISDKFTAKITQKNGDIFLKIHFKNYSNSLYLDKFECNSLAAKFSKILSRCEAYSSNFEVEYQEY